MIKYYFLLLPLITFNALAGNQEDCLRGFGIYSYPCEHKKTTKAALRENLTLSQSSNSKTPDQRGEDALEPAIIPSTSEASESSEQKGPELLNSVPPDRLRELEIMGAMEKLDRILTTEDEREIERQKAEAARQKKFQQLIHRNSIGVGMNPQQVIDSWGKPFRINPFSESIEQWIFQRRDGRDQIIYLENGKVSSWE
ncbi:hypothetical protein [Motiliproteus sp. MSK22-1]|uniref:hypothetical protein n=1 Tax=Motiliproteus sp. MSK22-1 TaxID=1897630 RepID=UPI0009765BBC|nr:hypothetical protein [Motiliproteus sp. MSK22-1]OMH38841.1 hypothetical protein BGP75_00225 [Motiliproteus sp. MSK22-1]